MPQSSLTVSTLFSWHWKMPFQTKYISLWRRTQPGSFHFTVNVWSFVPLGFPSLLNLVIVSGEVLQVSLYVFLLPEDTTIVSLSLHRVSRRPAIKSEELSLFMEDVCSHTHTKLSDTWLVPLVFRNGSFKGVLFLAFPSCDSVRESPVRSRRGPVSFWHMVVYRARCS